MRVVFPVLTTALVLGACDTRVADARAQVVANMWDAHATQFRREVSTDFAVCGEANGKTDQGAYVGFRRYIVAGDHVYLEPKPAEFGGEEVQGLRAAELGVGGRTAFDDLWRNVCLTGRPPPR